jgi:SAM-dependent methyltransferase
MKVTQVLRNDERYVRDVFFDGMGTFSPVSRFRSVVREAALTGSQLLLRGDDHECPCCDGRFARFIRRSESLVCPRCRSRERHRTLWLYLRDELRIEDSDARVLHLAPEAPLVKRLRAIPTLRYETADLKPGPMIDRTLDARALPFGAGSLDLIICSHVLEHIPEDVQVASEFARVLSPRGAALVQVPVNPTLPETFEDPAIVTPAQRERAYGQDDHVRIYGPDVLERLRAGGLHVRRVQYAEQVDPQLRSRYLLSERGLAPGGDIFRCTGLAGEG